MTDPDAEQDVMPVDADRGRAILQAYGAYSSGHSVPDDVTRVLADQCAVLADDQPGADRDALWAEAKRRADARG